MQEKTGRVYEKWMNLVFFCQDCLKKILCVCVCCLSSSCKVVNGMVVIWFGAFRWDVLFLAVVGCNKAINVQCNQVLCVVVAHYVRITSLVTDV